MRRLIVALGYISMLGPPHAIRLHAEARGTGGELDGVPLWLAVAAEFMVRSGIFLVISWMFQVALSNEEFRRFQVFNLLIAVYVSGAVHTLIHLYCFGFKWGRWSNARVHMIYRLGRNLVYSVIPAFPAAGLVLIWQEFNQMPLFQGPWVEWVFLGTWVSVAVLGLLQAFLVNRTPHGIARAMAPAQDAQPSGSVPSEKTPR